MFSAGCPPMNRLRLTSFVVTVLTGLWLVAPMGWGAEIHVAPSGNDVNPGTKQSPVVSVAAAQRLARAGAGREPVVVTFHGGTYYLPEALRFTAEDSGSAKLPVKYEAAA